MNPNRKMSAKVSQIHVCVYTYTEFCSYGKELANILQTYLFAKPLLMTKKVLSSKILKIN